MVESRRTKPYHVTVTVARDSQGDVVFLWRLIVASRRRHPNQPKGHFPHPFNTNDLREAAPSRIVTTGAANTILC